MSIKSFPKADPTKKQVDIYNDFSGGINTELADQSMKDNQFRKVINFDLDAAGALKKRPGLYKIPYVDKVIKEKLQEELQKGNIDSLIDLEIDDTIEFFDGSHWVFNYITNKGLVVLLLDKNMNQPKDLERFGNVLFYAYDHHKFGTQKFRTKITHYNNNWVMLRTFYAKPDIDSSVGNKERQIKIYSWNPILDVLFNNQGAIDYSKSFFPGWVEASEDKTNLKNKVYYEDAVTIYTDSKPLGDLVNRLPVNEITINSIKKSKYVDSNKHYEIELKQDSGTYLRVKEVINGYSTYRNIYLNHQTSESISFGDIHTICWIRKNTVRVYLKNYVKASHEFFLNNNELKNEYKQSIKWFDVDVSNGSIKYYRTPHQVPMTYDEESRILYRSRHSNSKLEYLHNGNNFASNCKYLTSIGLIYKVIKTNVKDNDEFNPEWWFNNTIWDSHFKYDVNIGKDYTYGFGCDIGFSHRSDTGYLKEEVYDFLWGDWILDNIDINNWQFKCDYSYKVFAWPENDNLGNAPQRKSQKSTANPGGNFNRTYYITYYNLLQIDYNNDDWYKHIWDENNFKNGLTKCNVSFSVNGNEYNTDLYEEYIKQDSYSYKSINTTTIREILVEQRPDITLTNDYSFFGNELFDETKLNQFWDHLTKGLIVNLNFVVTYGNNQEFVLKSNLKPYEYDDFIYAMKDKLNKNILFRYLKLRDNVGWVEFYWIDQNKKEHLLLRLDSTNITDFNNLVNTVKLHILAQYLPNGYIKQALEFKQLYYVKPNLNDLSYFWYNMVNFSNYSQSKYPDIYNKDIHKNISWDLVEYPTLTNNQLSPIQLYGIHPVNNVVLQPGNQLFQLFYSVKSGVNLDSYIVALTAMTIDDYSQMINSPDYSTTGFKSNNADVSKNEKCVGPNWVPFKSLFTTDDDNHIFDPSTQTWKPAPQKAVFEINIPSTTKPYMVLIQVAQLDKPQDGHYTPILASVRETRIEMQPNSSFAEKLNVESLFDEFTLTDTLGSYNSNLIAYGSSNKLYLSDVSAPTYFPLTNIITLSSPESINHCCLFQNKLIISTLNSKWYLGGSAFDSQSDPFHIKSISSDTGLLAPKSEIPLGNYLFFLDTSGIKILKNLYGTADKEFSFENIDTLISSLVPRDTKACGVSYNNKYYICFPTYKFMLVYNLTYKSWIIYESKFMNFTKMFVDNNILYGVDKDNFNIYKFDENVYVDGWNEFEDDGGGYIETTTFDNVSCLVQDGTPIECVLETKILDQYYTIYKKHYDWALLNAITYGAYKQDDGKIINTPTSIIEPSVYVDDNKINYEFNYYTDINNCYNYSVHNQDRIVVRDDSIISHNISLDFSKLGKNDNNSDYKVPIRRGGKGVSFEFKHKAPCGFKINSLSIKYNLIGIKMNNKGVS